MVLATFLGISSAVNQQKAAEAARKAQDARLQYDNLQAARAKRQLARDKLRISAALEQGSENAGVAMSSGALGGRGGMETAANVEASFLDRGLQLQRQAGSFLDSSAKYEARAGFYSQAFNML